jgi:L-alanine-DL-glutamate epimerase-like enolase superfamily enzyme
LQTSVKTVEVHTRRTFAIARSSADAFERVVFEIEAGGVTGRGEAAPTSYYGQDASVVALALEDVEITDPSSTTTSFPLRRSRRSTTRCTISRRRGSACPSTACSGWRSLNPSRPTRWA